MRKPTLAIKEDKKTKRWRIEGYRENGKRSRKFYKTKIDAEQKLKELQMLQEREGLEAQHLPPESRRDAASALKLLAPYSVTLVDAAKFYVSHQEQAGKSKTIDQALAEYLLRMKQHRLRERSLNDARVRLTKFAATYGSTLVCNIQPKNIHDWIHGLGNFEAQTLNNYITILKTFFKYCMDSEYISFNPVVKVKKLKIAKKPIVFYTPTEMKTLLSGLTEDCIPMVAIGAFAGVRTEERCKLTWEDINFETKTIVISAENAKTPSRRTIAIQPVLESWLEPHKNKTGLIWPKGTPDSWHKHFSKARKAAKIAKWDENVLRHSFASYHLAYFNDILTLTREMGHNSGNMLFKHYAEVVSKADATSYWSLTRKSVKESSSGNG